MTNPTGGRGKPDAWPTSHPQSMPLPATHPVAFAPAGGRRQGETDEPAATGPELTAAAA